jgi:hypothetical protein
MGTFVKLGDISLAVLVTATFCLPAQASDIYIAQSATGKNSGQDCANAFAYTFFNKPGNWGTNSGQIGPGTTVHLCGVFVDSTPGDTLLSFQGSGSSGSAITLLFEPDSSLTNTAYWGSNTAGAIQVNARSYLVIDGGPNGLIQNTGNGTGLTYEHNSSGVVALNSSNVTIKNLNISQICNYRGSASDTTGCVTSGSYDTGITVNGGIDNTIINNTVHDSAICIFYEPWTGQTGTLISSNTAYHCNWGIGVAAPSALATGLVISGNDIYDSFNWDNPSDTFHHNGIHIYSVSSGSGLVGTTINNNYIHGTMSGCLPNSCTTAWIYLDQNAGKITGTLGFNNVLVNGGSTQGPGNGYITGAQGVWYNNTIYGNGLGTGITAASGTIIQNNVLANLRQFIFGPSSALAMDYNSYMAISPSGCSAWVWGGGTCTGQANISAWRAACACDQHSTYNNGVTVSPSGPPLAGSPVLTLGENLTFLAVTGLATDKAGVARPSTGAWATGAFQDPGLLSPPTSLTVVAH